jgi:drug/metabolite transporter (DMT)-like permease
MALAGAIFKELSKDGVTPAEYLVWSNAGNFLLI